MKFSVLGVNGYSIRHEVKTEYGGVYFCKREWTVEKVISAIARSYPGLDRQSVQMSYRCDHTGLRCCMRWVAGGDVFEMSMPEFTAFMERSVQAMDLDMDTGCASGSVFRRRI